MFVVVTRNARLMLNGIGPPSLGRSDEVVSTRHSGGIAGESKQGVTCYDTGSVQKCQY